MRSKKKLSASGVMVAAGFLMIVGSSATVRAHAGPQEAPAASSQGRMSITVQNGRLTADIDDYLLPPVLEALSSRTGVRLFPADNLDVDEKRISAEMRDAPIDQGLRRLLSDYDTFFYYGVVGNDPAVLRAVWIYRKGEASGVRPVPPELWASSRELEDSLADANPEVRLRAYEALLSRPGRDSRERVLQALRGATEKDSALRELLLSAAFAMGMRLPSDLLSDLVRWDSSDGIRMMALDALAADPAVKQLALIALADRNAAIRAKAKEILENLEAAEFAPQRAGQEVQQ